MSRYNGTRRGRSPSKAEASPPASTPPKKHLTWYGRLYPEQRHATDFILERPATALFCKAGTGKTLITLAMLERSQWRVALIVAPFTSLDVTWYPRITTLPHTLIHRGITELAGSLKSSPRAHTRHIVLTNPEALRRSLRRIAKLPWDVVVWDESQGIKNRSSVASRLARRLRHVPRRLALSGTPLDTGQIDIWAQMRFVDHEVFGENWRDFAEEYCYKTGWMNKEWRFNPRKDRQFLKALEPYIYRLDDSFLGLKPMSVVPVPINLLGEQRRIYETMERDNLVMLPAGMITAENQGARDVKLSQITGGAVLDADGNVHPTGQAKRRRLKHMIATLERPLVIFCQFLHELEIVMELVPFERVEVVQGATRIKDRTRIINAFQAGKIDVLICQIRTAGESIDLTRAATLVMYSMTYSYINFEQVLRRLQRGGQTRAVTAYILYCVSTVDDDKLRLVQQKCETSDTILAHFEE